MKAPLYDIKGKQKGTLDLEASHFGVTPNMSLVHRLLLLQQANGRIAIAHTKRRGEVAGSTRKLYKQKGTGRARMGDKRSPMLRGGGVAFGPRSEQNWAISMNRKERRLALLSLLSTKATNESVKVVENFEKIGQKTKSMTEFLSTTGIKRPIFAITRDERTALLGANNIADSRIVNVEYLNPHDLLKYTDLVLTEASLAHLYKHFA
jgi:large subunit ribosomal protein L4